MTTSTKFYGPLANGTFTTLLLKPTLHTEKTRAGTDSATETTAKTCTMPPRPPDMTEVKVLATPVRMLSQTPVTLTVRPPLATMLLSRLLLLGHRPTCRRAASPLTMTLPDPSDAAKHIKAPSSLTSTMTLWPRTERCSPSLSPLSLWLTTCRQCRHTAVPWHRTRRTKCECTKAPKFWTAFLTNGRSMGALRT